MPASTRPRLFIFITSCPEVWGGSEELWAGAAIALRKRGHRVMCGRTEPAKKWKQHAKWRQLHASGIRVGAFGVPTLFRAVPDAFLRYVEPCAPFAYGLRNRALAFWLRRLDPDLVVIAQGNTYDGMYSVEMPLIVQYTGKPYVLVCQKNAETEWPSDFMRARNRGHFAKANKVYFVSEHNRTIAERQLGMAFANAEVVRNPFNTSVREPLPWPERANGIFRLACVGRLYAKEKGQDILLEVLARRQWRERPIEVSFHGSGSDAAGLEGMAEFLGLKNVRFRGFSDDVTAIWRENHALVLPSRAEGLPLAQVEAMICGRVCIMCPAGGAGEILEDGITGFVASASTPDALDEAMERAWTKREEWPEIGRNASASVWRYFPHDPCAVLADKLEAML